MKKMTIAAVVLVAALSARATGFDELTLWTNVWFEAAFTNVEDGTAIVDDIGITQGDGLWSWTAPSGGTAITATENETWFIALSSDLNEQLTFTPAPFAVTSGYETVVATIKAEAGDELPVVDGNPAPQAAFTVIVTNNELQAFGLTSAGWTNLVYGSVKPLTNNWFTLYMDFANEIVNESTTNRFVRYSVLPQGQSEATILTDNTDASWFPTAYSPTINNISFGGMGKVQTFSCDELTVPISFGNTVVSFLADYQTAETIETTVSGTVAADTTFTLTVGDKPYPGKYDAGSVTFYNVTLTNEFALGSTVGYTLSATNAVNNYTGTAAPAQQQTTVGKRSGGWIAENKDNCGSGAWTNSAEEEVPLEYNGTPAVAALNNHLFTPTNAVGDAIVTVESQVCFGDVADPAVAAGPDSYAAIRLAEVNSTPTFQIWAKATEEAQADWISVFNGKAVDPTSTTTVQSNFDFVKGTCSFYVGGVALTNASGEASFYLANGVRKLTKINFNGVGTLTSLNGSYLATEQIAQAVDGTNVTVSSKWVAKNLPHGTTIEQARTLLDPDNSTDTTTHGSSQYNYFECYALGIDPIKEEEAPIITATPDGTGKFGMKLEGINVPEGVTLTVTLQGSNSPSSEFTDLEKPKATAVGKSDGTTTTSGAIEFDPATDMDGNVKYLKMDVSIGATP